MSIALPGYGLGNAGGDGLRERVKKLRKPSGTKSDREKDERMGSKAK